MQPASPAAPKSPRAKNRCEPAGSFAKRQNGESANGPMGEPDAAMFAISPFVSFTVSLFITVAVSPSCRSGASVVVLVLRVVGVAVRVLGCGAAREEQGACEHQEQAGQFQVQPCPCCNPFHGCRLGSWLFIKLSGSVAHSGGGAAQFLLRYRLVNPSENCGRVRCRRLQVANAEVRQNVCLRGCQLGLWAFTAGRPLLPS